MKSLLICFVTLFIIYTFVNYTSAEKEVSSDKAVTKLNKESKPSSVIKPAKKTSKLKHVKEGKKHKYKKRKHRKNKTSIFRTNEQKTKLFKKKSLK